MWVRPRLCRKISDVHNVTGRGQDGIDMGIEENLQQMALLFEFMNGLSPVKVTICAFSASARARASSGGERKRIREGKWRYFH